MNFNLQLHNYQIDLQPQVIPAEVTEQELHNLESELNLKEKALDLIAETKRLI